MNVKIIIELSPETLEYRINKYIEEIFDCIGTTKIIDIKFSSFNGGSNWVYSSLIMWEHTSV